MKLYDLKQMNSHLFILYFRKYRSAGVLGGFVLLLLAVSCHTHRTSFPPGLAEAETWVNVHPDSALGIVPYPCLSKKNLFLCLAGVESHGFYLHLRKS